MVNNNHKIGQLYNYFNSYLVNKIYKILPLYEESNKTLPMYIDSLLIEAVGLSDIIDINNSSYISLLATLGGIKREVQEDNNKNIIRRETFKCIDISKNIAETIE